MKPKTGSKQDRLLKAFENGGMSVDTLINNHGYFGFTSAYEIKNELQTLVNYKCLKLEGNMYFIATKGNGKLEIVPSREPFEFKPLKTFLPKESPRGQKIETRSFKTCTSDIKYWSEE